MKGKAALCQGATQHKHAAELISAYRCVYDIPHNGRTQREVSKGRYLWGWSEFQQITEDMKCWQMGKSLMSITNLNGEGGSPHISDYLRTLWTTTLEMKAFNRSGEINRCHYYEWSILSCVYSIFFCLLYNHTSRDKWPFHGQLGRGSHTSRVIKVADKSFFFFNESGCKCSASSCWDYVRVCLGDALQCVKKPGFISSCNTLMTLLFHSYPASRSYYHINTCVIKALQTISWII